MFTRKVTLMTLVQAQVSTVTFKDANFVRQFPLLPISPINFAECPFLSKMSRNDSMLVHLVSSYQLIQETKQLVNLRSGKIRIVRSILNLKCI